MATFNVTLKKTIDESYDIEIGKNLYGKLIEDLTSGLIPKVSKYLIITDYNCEKLYGTRLLRLLIDNGLEADLLAFEPGEKNKSRYTKAWLEDQMIEKSFRRDSCIIALGGGVVTDLVGFLAGTYCRGIPVIYYATTILAAADASIGGKTAIDTPAATNYIGLFNQPNKIYIDLETWKTLPAREIKVGLVETIKHACIIDKDFFEYLENNIEKIIDSNGTPILDDEVCDYISNKNCSIKYSVVTKDEKESNYRQVLNLGHTIGRALEPLTDYTLNHGEAVSIGLSYQAHIASHFKYLDNESKERIIALLIKAGLPTEIPKEITTKSLVEKMHTDKKSRNNKIRFVFQEEIGKIRINDDGNYSIPVEDKELEQIINQLRK